MIPYESWSRPHTSPITPADKAAGRIAWGVIALVLLLIAFTTVSCSSSRNVGTTDARHNASIQAPLVGVSPTLMSVTSSPDSLDELVQKRRFFGLLLPRKANSKPETKILAGAGFSTRKCKGCQFVIQNGNGNTSTQSSTAKKAQSATGDGAKVAVAGKNSTQATDSAVAVASEGGAVAAGPGASASGGATVTKPGFWATLAKPLGYFACAVGVVGVGYLLYLIWGFLPRRKPENQA